MSFFYELELETKRYYKALSDLQTMVKKYSFDTKERYRICVHFNGTYALDLIKGEKSEWLKIHKIGDNKDCARVKVSLNDIHLKFPYYTLLDWYLKKTVLTYSEE